MAPGLQNWHLDKRVPLGIIGAIICQTVVLVWYASKIDSRVAALEAEDMRASQSFAQRSVIVDARLEGMRADRDRLIKVEAQLDYIAATLRRLEQKLDGAGGR